MANAHNPVVVWLNKCLKYAIGVIACKGFVSCFLAFQYKHYREHEQGIMLAINREHNKIAERSRCAEQTFYKELRRRSPYYHILIGILDSAENVLH